MQGRLPARRDLGICQLTTHHNFTVSQNGCYNFYPQLLHLSARSFLSSHTHTQQGREAVAESLSYTRFSSDPTSVPVVGELVKFAKFLCNSQIPNQLRLMMSDLQNPNLASDSNTLCGFQQVSTPFCFCLPMAKMFICLSHQVFRENS